MLSNVIEQLAYRDEELVFKDRLHAGALLAGKLRSLLADRDVCPLALPVPRYPTESSGGQKCTRLQQELVATSVEGHVWSEDV